MDSDFEKKARNWAIESIRAGKSEEELRKIMLSKGYSYELINKAFSSARKKASFKKYLSFVAMGLVILALILLAYLYSSYLFRTTCNSDECFILKANSCSPVKIEKTIAGSLYQLSENKCITTKTLVQMNSTEPSGLKSLIEGKSLQCVYGPGNFDRNLLNSVSLGIENCSGELKDSLDEILSVI
jgi:hypothetical protein